jgi:hypothetical protein
MNKTNAEAYNVKQQHSCNIVLIFQMNHCKQDGIRPSASMAYTCITSTLVLKNKRLKTSHFTPSGKTCVTIGTNYAHSYSTHSPIKDKFKDTLYTLSPPPSNPPPPNHSNHETPYTYNRKHLHKITDFKSALLILDKDFGIF